MSLNDGKSVREHVSTLSANSCSALKDVIVALVVLSPVFCSPFGWDTLAYSAPNNLYKAAPLLHAFYDFRHCFLKPTSPETSNESVAYIQ